MLPFDIIKLVLTYSTPIPYKLPAWIDKSIRNKIYRSSPFAKNPKNFRYILKNPEQFGYEILENPAPELKFMIMARANQLSNSEIINAKIFRHIANNKSNDPGFIKFITDKIIRAIDEFIDQNSSDVIELGNLFRLISRANTSKDIFDKYIYENCFSDEYYYGYTFSEKYPYFPNESEETNIEYFMKMFDKLKSHPYGLMNGIWMQAWPIPIIIKYLEIAYGLSETNSMDFDTKQRLYELLGPLSNFQISRNPGAIHILKALPELIDSVSIYQNPRVGELIDLGIIKPKPKLNIRDMYHRTSQTNSMNWLCDWDEMSQNELLEPVNSNRFMNWLIYDLFYS